MKIGIFSSRKNSTSRPLLFYCFDYFGELALWVSKLLFLKNNIFRKLDLIFFLFFKKNLTFFGELSSFFSENNPIFWESRVCIDSSVVWGKFYFLRLLSGVSFPVFICQEQK